MKQVCQTDLSEMYRLMIYFAHSTLMIYSKTIKCEKNMSINDFRNENEAVIARVSSEAISIFSYELSYEQITRAIHVYFITKFNPSSVLDRDVFEVNRLG